MDGSVHFYNLTDHELAKTTLKYRLMEKAGLKLIRLEHHQLKTGVKVNKEAILEAVYQGISLTKN